MGREREQSSIYTRLACADEYAAVVAEAEKSSRNETGSFGFRRRCLIRDSGRAIFVAPIVSDPEVAPRAPSRRVGDYAIYGEIARGGMATLHLGRITGAGGFSRTVAIKRLHPQYARNPEFVAQLLDEAQLTSRIRHPNVVPVLDVVARNGELLIVMEYVHGEALSRLARGGPVEPKIVSALMVQVLLGLHAAHEAKSENGAPLEIVHRDVSPHNIIVDVDGAAMVLDFGVAKAARSIHQTEQGQIKGKLAYMAPEQLRGHSIDRRVDVFAAGIVMWELLTGKRLFARDEPLDVVAAIEACAVPMPSQFAAEISTALDLVVLRALSADPSARFQTAREMAAALEAAVTPAGSMPLRAWVETRAIEALEALADQVREAEDTTSAGVDIDKLTKELAERRQSPPPLAAPVAPDTPKKRRAPLVLIASAVLILGAIVVWGTTKRSAATVAAAAPVVPTTSVHEIASAEPTSAQPDAPPEPGQQAVLASELPLEPVTAPVASVRSRFLRQAISVCAVPFVVDAQGRKHFRPECFKR